MKKLKEVVEVENEGMVSLLGNFKEDDMESLGTALPKEQARVREVLGHYKEIGPAGMFAATMIEQSLQKADQAVISGDVVAMMVAYQDLQKIES